MSMLRVGDRLINLDMILEIGVPKRYYYDPNNGRHSYDSFVYNEGTEDETPDEFLARLQEKNPHIKDCWGFRVFYVEGNGYKFIQGESKSEIEAAFTKIVALKNHNRETIPTIEIKSAHKYRNNKSHEMHADDWI